VASNAESAYTSALARASGLALSRDKRRSTRACVALVVVGSDRIKERCTGGTLVAFCARPCRDVPGAASTTKPACASAQPHLHLRGRLDSLTRARAAPVVVGLETIKGWGTGGRHVAFHERPCRDEPGAASTGKSACASALARALWNALSRGRRRST
jgi:hypothetical protein